MSHWFGREWLPELEAVEWPRLDELRAEHRRLVAVYYEATRERAALWERFEHEDSDMRAEVLAAARAGREPASEAPATSQLRRNAELQVASERVAAAFRELGAFVIRAAEELRGRWGESETAERRAQEAAARSGATRRREAVERDMSKLRVLLLRGLGDGLGDVQQQVERACPGATVAARARAAA